MGKKWQVVDMAARRDPGTPQNVLKIIIVFGQGAFPLCTPSRALPLPCAPPGSRRPLHPGLFPFCNFSRVAPMHSLVGVTRRLMHHAQTLRLFSRC